MNEEGCILSDIGCFGGCTKSSYELCHTCFGAHNLLFKMHIPEQKRTIDQEVAIGKAVVAQQEITRDYPCIIRQDRFSDKNWVGELVQIKLGFDKMKLRSSPLPLKPSARWSRVVEPDRLCGLCVNVVEKLDQPKGEWYQLLPLKIVDTIYKLRPDWKEGNQTKDESEIYNVPC